MVGEGLKSDYIWAWSKARGNIQSSKSRIESGILGWVDVGGDDLPSKVDASIWRFRGGLGVGGGGAFSGHKQVPNE